MATRKLSGSGSNAASWPNALFLCLILYCLPRNPHPVTRSHVVLPTVGASGELPAFLLTSSLDLHQFN